MKLPAYPFLICAVGCILCVFAPKQSPEVKAIFIVGFLILFAFGTAIIDQKKDKE